MAHRRLGADAGRLGPHRHDARPLRSAGAERLERGDAAFLGWFNDGPASDPVIKAALAHLWFVTIHPFDDGNGRIARAITDLALARSEHSAQRFYSMSGADPRRAQDLLRDPGSTQKGTLDVTPWLRWFLACLERAFDRAETILGAVLHKARFWETHRRPVNERQRAVLNRLLDGFEGKLTSSKWAKLAKCSQDTALRDIDDLLSRGILAKNDGGGRSTSYSLVLPSAGSGS